MQTKNQNTIVAILKLNMVATNPHGMDFNMLIGHVKIWLANLSTISSTLYVTL